MDTLEKSQPSGGKRKIALLLVVVGLLYAAILISLYAYSSSIDLKALLFGPAGEAGNSSQAPGDTPTLELSLNPPEDDMVLPPLDDAPQEEASPSSDIPLDIHAAAQRLAATKTVIKSDVTPVPIPGVSFTSRISPIKCWDQRGFEHGAADCDTLGELSLLAEYHLDMLESCRTDTTTPLNTGTFAIFAEADFVRKSINIWPGTASTLRDADKIADCVTDRWRTLPFMGIPHRFTRYRMKGVVRFEGARRASAAPIAVTPSRSVELEKAAADAEEVTVSRERVRIRKVPVNGEIIGFISTGQRVKLIEVTDEWCLVKTKRGNLGWMICWGLDLQQKQIDHNGPPPQSN